MNAGLFSSAIIDFIGDFFLAACVDTSRAARILIGRFRAKNKLVETSTS